MKNSEKVAVEIREEPSADLARQLSQLAGSTPEGWDLLRALRVAHEEGLSLGAGGPFFTDLSAIVQNWRQTPAGENELAFVLVAAIEEPEETEGAVFWLLDAGVSPHVPHTFENEERGKPAYPLAVAVKCSMAQAVFELVRHGAAIDDQTIKAAVFEWHCRERTVLGSKNATARQFEAIGRAENIALSLLVGYPGVDVWRRDEAIGPSIMHWACCLPHDRMLRALSALPQGDLQGVAAQPFIEGLLSIAIVEASGTKTMEALIELAAVRQKDLDRAVIVAAANNKTAWLYALLEKGASTHLAKKWAAGEPQDDRLKGLHPYAGLRMRNKDTADRGLESLAAWEESRLLAQEVNVVSKRTKKADEHSLAGDGKPATLRRRRRVL